MAKFMDVHSGFTGVTEDQLREAHQRDLDIETAEGVHFERAWDDGRIDELGNGRFARSLFERTCAARDLRVAAELGDQASAADLTIVTAADLAAAVTELTGEPGYPGPQ